MLLVTFIVVVSMIWLGFLTMHLGQRQFRIGEPRVPRLPPPVRRARRATLDACQPGEHVAIVGVIVTPDDLKGPLSGRPCVAYELSLFDAETREQVGRSVGAQAIVIQDDGGRATVDTSTADLRVWHDPPTFLFDGPQLAAVAALTGAPPGRPVYAYEGRMTRGQDVLVVGVVQAVETFEGAAYRTAPTPAALALVASEDAVLVVSDRVADREHFPQPSVALLRI